MQLQFQAATSTFIPWKNYRNIQTNCFFFFVTFSETGLMVWSKPTQFSSTILRAFWKASSKLRPIAITSPVKKKNSEDLPLCFCADAVHFSAPKYTINDAENDLMISASYQHSSWSCQSWWRPWGTCWDPSEAPSPRSSPNSAQSWLLWSWSQNSYRKQSYIFFMNEITQFQKSMRN